MIINKFNISIPEYHITSFIDEFTKLAMDCGYFIFLGETMYTINESGTDKVKKLLTKYDIDYTMEGVHYYNAELIARMLYETYILNYSHCLN